MDGWSDVDLASDGLGNLYYVGLNPDLVVRTHVGPIPFQTSPNNGTTWTPPQDLSGERSGDRQWITARQNGTVYVSWSAFNPARKVMKVSFDRGETWSPMRIILSETYITGPPAADPASDAVYVPHVGPQGSTFDGSVRIARSRDHGVTWDLFRVTPADSQSRALRPGNPTFTFPVASVDRAGGVYVVWSVEPPGSSPMGARETAVPRVFLAASRDQGLTWTKPFQLSPPGRAAIMPWIVAGDRGRVAVAWLENVLGYPSETVPDLWNVRLVESLDAETENPTFLGGLVNRDPVHLGQVCTDGARCLALGKDRSRGELFEIALGPDGHPHVAWANDPSTQRGRLEIYAARVLEGTPLLVRSTIETGA